jgi:Cu-Zn family superoxide dismutase
MKLINFIKYCRGMAVAVFQQPNIQGEVVFQAARGGIQVHASFSKLPPGLHGFHIHKAGDLRGEGCKGACDHYDITGSQHGDAPPSNEPRHTGDLGNIHGPSFVHNYFLKKVHIEDLYGRSVIVHQDEDDLGKGNYEDSKTTGHSGARIGCAIIGRISCEHQTGGRKKTQTRKRY